MQHKFSIVIVCKNEADIIEKVLLSICHLSDDIVVYDSGSTDGTIGIIKKYEVKLYEGEWFGYGKTKQHAVNLARYDWVLSIDADEAPDEELQQQLQQINFTPSTAYRIRFKNYLGDKWLRWGEWGGDTHIRLFNKNEVNWNDAGIHEQLNIPSDIKVVNLKGHILHYTMKDTADYSKKMVKYALLNADKYYVQNKKATFLKRYISPLFSFAKHYIFQLGFLDGYPGFVSAYMTFFYTFLKYARLHELHQKNRPGKKN